MCVLETFYRFTRIISKEVNCARAASKVDALIVTTILTRLVGCIDAQNSKVALLGQVTIHVGLRRLVVLGLVHLAYPTLADQ